MQFHIDASLRSVQVFSSLYWTLMMILMALQWRHHKFCKQYSNMELYTL